jgi:hypothetical protein
MEFHINGVLIFSIITTHNANRIPHLLTRTIKVTIPYRTFIHHICMIADNLYFLGMYWKKKMCVDRGNLLELSTSHINELPTWKCFLGISDPYILLNDDLQDYGKGRVFKNPY